MSLPIPWFATYPDLSPSSAPVLGSESTDRMQEIITGVLVEGLLALAWIAILSGVAVWIKRHSGRRRADHAGQGCQ